MKNKLINNNKGETLVETLFSILIITLSAVIFATMSVTASQLDNRSEKAKENLNSHMIAAEEQTGTGTQGKLIIKSSDGTVLDDKNVLFYGNDGIYSFKAEQ